jgi:hypothetical protein
MASELAPKSGEYDLNQGLCVAAMLEFAQPPESGAIP